MSGIKEFFNENGYYHAKGVFQPDEIAALEHDFDGIVRQLTDSGEVVDATWDGGETDKIARAGDVILSGTPAGVGPVQRGDVLEVGIKGFEPLRVVVV